MLQSLRAMTITPFKLGREEAAFLRIQHLSILAASRGPDNIPFVIRAMGWRLSPHADSISVLLPAEDARELLEHVAGNGQIAVTFALPATHQALQLKGSDAKVEKVLKTDRALAKAYRKAFVGHLEELGYPGAVFEAMFADESEGLAAVKFTPSSAFSQTPGPNAGQAIGAVK